MAKTCLLILFSLLLLLACVTVIATDTDPELKQCQDKCGQQLHFGREKVAACYQGCMDYHLAKERIQKHYQGPQKEYEECVVQCGRQPEESSYTQEKCQKDCNRQLKEKLREAAGGTGRKQGNESPYVFKERHFLTGLQSQHVRLRVLPKFTDRSPLLHGIENYRVSIFEAAPQTFVLPSHWDADSVFFVVNGRGTLSLVQPGKRESFNFRQGDLVRIREGTAAYIVNGDYNQRLILAELIMPVNAPGEFQTYFEAGGGGGNQGSIYSVFSDEILEAAFNTRRDVVKRLIGQQKERFAIKASEEQIRELSRHEQGGIWPFGGGSRGSLNLYEQRPTRSNQYGQLYVADSSRFRPLRDLNLIVSLANITQGGMTALYYNSKATEIAIVVDGQGFLEMACPHLAKQQGGPHYERVSTRLRRGTVVVIPAGHPFVTWASKDQNLQVLCFEVNAQDNEKFMLAGKRNIVSMLEKEAKELTFGLPAREVDAVFGPDVQKEEFFFKGPSQQSRQRAHA